MADPLITDIEDAFDALLTGGTRVPETFNNVGEWMCWVHGDSREAHLHVATPDHTRIEWRHYRMSRIYAHGLLDQALSLPPEFFTKNEWKWMEKMALRRDIRNAEGKAAVDWLREQFS